ncbi:Gfo/Idh/MocA family oxidoreductase [Halomontanus rarus]|uniref:Gfo/Idh/MocA family protein n=1 Tax=Halomontanus rarus TaxID=3034020 RepID=UPI002FFAE574
MTRFTVAVIGTGPEPDNIVWGESAAMAYRHGEAYEGLSQCDLVGCADIVRENAEAFADEFDIADENVYEDYQEMLHAVEPDVVSICTPVPTHAELVIGAAETEVPRAIHCEKPMADTWADCKRMADAADDHGVQLTFNHQRRFSPQWQEATRLLEDGVVGDVERVEMGEGDVDMQACGSRRRRRLAHLRARYARRSRGVDRHRCRVPRVVVTTVKRSRPSQ